MSKRILVFVPTYNERDNVNQLTEQILALRLPLDLLFLDDNSPDGTGILLDELAQKHANIQVIHGSGKKGIGAAHKRGIRWAYNHGYEILVTMDADFTHSPAELPHLIAQSQFADVVVGSRYLNQGSLAGWNFFRKFLTRLGHFLTRRFLYLPEDASGAYRLYRLNQIRAESFERVRSTSYSFFFESLFILRQNGCRLKEIPIVLTPRTYGHSKMTSQDAWSSLCILLSIWAENIRRPEQYLLDRPVSGINESLKDPQNWEIYWGKKDTQAGLLYEFMAGAYRQGVIRANLNRAIRRVFAPNSRLLHAGCGSGQVDVDLQREMKVAALDISASALNLYARNNPLVQDIHHGNIFHLPMEAGSFDGIYNLGVMEHFTVEEIKMILAEFHRTLKSHGKIVIFWPHQWATSVWFLKMVKAFFKIFLGWVEEFHPPEITYCQGRPQMEALLRSTGFALISYDFGWRDFFVQAVVVAERL